MKTDEAEGQIQTADRTKYGYCRLTRRWVPRDEMRSINAKVFALDGSYQIVRLRLSPEGFREIMDLLESLRWDGVLRERWELEASGDLRPEGEPVGVPEIPR